jgi:hypothetical protein
VFSNISFAVLEFLVELLILYVVLNLLTNLRNTCTKTWDLQLMNFVGSMAIVTMEYMYLDF